MPRLIQGEGSVNEIVNEITREGYTAVFLITGKHFQYETDFFRGLSISHFIKSGVNVEIEEAEKAFQQFSQNKMQAIVAIGGGSAMDIAKYIIYQLANSLLPIPFFITAPTTAGSGSEATHFSVIYAKKKKISLAHPSLLPQLTVLDPALTYSLPPYQTAVSGMDMFAQAVESYWNVNATDESRGYATESILSWMKFFNKAVMMPDAEARKEMLWAAHLAGKAINITRTSGPHALSYYLTANHNIAHGQAVGVFLPVFFLYNGPQTDLCNMLGVKNEKEAMQMISQKMKEAGLAVTFGELGIEKEKIVDDLLNEVNEERFANNPEKFDRDSLKQLIIQYL